jgi:peptidoglycan hydrolase-like protein with peptidoglycan-binding domain
VPVKLHRRTVSHPDKWNALGEYAKGLVTLSSAIITLTAGFSANLLGKATSTWQIYSLMAALGLLSVAVLCAAFSHSEYVAYSGYARDKNRKRAIGFANAASWILSFGVVSFGVFAYFCFSQPSPSTDAHAVAKKVAAEIADVYGVSQAALQLRSTDWSDRSKLYSLAFDDPSHHRTIVANFDVSAGHILDSKAVESPPPVSAPPAANTLVFYDAFDVQMALLGHGYRAGPIDGIVGVKTRSALKKFQRDHRMPAMGQFDKDTLQALSELTAQSPRVQGTSPPSK